MGWKDLFPKENRYFETENGILYCGDCLEIMKKILDKSIDLVIIDPPYGISYQKKGKPAMIGDYGNVLGLVLPEFYRILKDNGAIYIFTSFKMLADWLYRFQSYFKMHNLIIWDKKKNSGLQMGSNYGFRYEMIFFGSKGLHKLNAYHDDVISIEKEKKRYHPTQKPTRLIEIFIKMSSKENDLILDCFLGSGTTAIACEKLNRRWIGIEINKEYCEITKERILKK